MTAPGRLRLRSSIAVMALLGSLFSSTPARAQMVSTNCTYDGRSTVDLYMTGSADGYSVTRDKRGAVTFSDYYGDTGPLACSGGGTANRATEVNIHGADYEGYSSQDIYIDLVNFRGVALDVSLGGESDDDYLFLYLTDASETFSELGGAGLSSFAAASDIENVYLRGRGGADVLSWDGTDGSYVELFGDAGDDRLSAGEADVDLSGGDGNDILYGSSFAQTMFGGAGADVLYGEDGDDYLYGQAGADRLFGGPGNDRLNGSDGTRPASVDLLSGGGNVDTCIREGADTLDSCETVQKA